MTEPLESYTRARVTGHQRIVKAALPCRIVHGDWRWRCVDTAWAGRAAAAGPVIDARDRGGDSPARVIKQNHQKCVLRVERVALDDPALSDGAAEDADEDGDAVVLKVFHLDTWRRRRRRRRFGWNEAANALTAAQRRVPAPRLLGYGQRRGPLGAPDRQAIMMQSLDDHTPVRDRLRAAARDPGAAAAVLARTTSLFVALHRAGCLHIDVNASNVMVYDDADHPATLLDFQHARFRDRASLEWLMFEAAHFARSCARHCLDADFDAWAAGILDAIALTDPAQRAASLRRFHFYIEADLSRRRRRSIRP